MPPINQKKSNSSFDKKEREKGLSILYVVLITSILLAISFGISKILVQQIKMMGEIGHSVVSFYAADSGLEKSLTDHSNTDPPSEYSGNLPNGSSYQVSRLRGGIDDCSAEFNYCIKSTGEYLGARRAIEIKY